MTAKPHTAIPTTMSVALTRMDRYTAGGWSPNPRDSNEAAIHSDRRRATISTAKTNLKASLINVVEEQPSDVPTPVAQALDRQRPKTQFNIVLAPAAIAQD